MSTITVTGTDLEEGGSPFDFTAYGGHTVIYLAVPGGTAANPTMKHYRLDLHPDQSPESRDGAVQINVVPVDARGWPDPKESTSWRIGDEQAQAALARAVVFRRHQADYTYGYTGVGCNRYNCSLFAEKILKAAGVKQSSGLIFSTPLELVKNQKLPNRPQPKEAAAEAPATEPGVAPALYRVD